MDLKGKTVIVLGAGRSGRAAARLARHHGAHVSVHDAGGEAAFAGIDAGIAIYPHADVASGLASRADFVVVSPGIETGGEFVQGYAANAGELLGEVELAARFYAGRIVGITGTNGKTTTTEVVQRIFAAAGMRTAACGNYGPPFAEVVLDGRAPDAVSLELSSFQLETLSRLHPTVAVWLNFAPDHMDRYRSVEEYFAAKLRIFTNQTAHDTAVLRAGEELGELTAKRVTFTTEERPADYRSDGTTIFHQGVAVLDMTATKLRGLHNAENLMAAMAAVAEFGITPEVVASALAAYAPPRHRCELVRTLDGVEFINDSKATNLHALESALRSQTRPVVLIAGGKEKGLDYRPLLPALQRNVRAAVTFGQIGGKLAEVFGEVTPALRVATLAEAVRNASSQARRGDTILFSPGTSSFDMFNGYEDRGDAFCSLVLDLK
jgi:UDP-N-acetylmuramoylalanine--D-glutamate ligase